MKREMKNLATSVLFFAGAVSAFGQYTLGKSGAPPAEVSPGIIEVLQKDGMQVKSGDKVFADIWFRSSLPAGAKTSEDNVTLTNVAHGALLGIIRFPANGADRRGNKINAGVYTLRYSMFPPNGDHQGVAPQRDFLLISRAADDIDPNSVPGFKALTEASMKATGLPHPGVFSVWKSEQDAKPGLTLEGEHDWVLRTKIGDTPFAMIVYGKADH